MKRALSQPGGAWQLKWRLPSPTWPNGTRPAAGQRLLHRRQPFRHERRDLAHRHRDVVLDRRAFALLRLGMVLAQRPEGAWPAPRSGRARRRAPGPSPSPRRDRLPSSRAGRRLVGARARAAGSTTIPSARTSRACSASGSARAGDVLQHQVDALAAHQLAGGDVVLATRHRRRSAAPRRPAARARPIHEVATSLGLGQSFSIALVMMPSVPSAPR